MQWQPEPQDCSHTAPHVCPQCHDANRIFQYIRGTPQGNLCLIIKNATGWLTRKKKIALIYSLMAPLWKLLLTFDLSDIKQSIFSRPATFITAPTDPQGVKVLNFMGLGCRTTLRSIIYFIIYWFWIYSVILRVYWHVWTVCFFISFMCCSVWPLSE